MSKANENNADSWTRKGIEDMKEDVQHACEMLLTALGIDYQEDPQTKDTPKRMAKMYVEELCRGRYEERPDLREFPNTQNLDQLYVVGPVTITSLCSHHMVPFIGKAWIGILPNSDGNVLGLSKFSRMADWVFNRPQIQEEATIMLANELEDVCKPQGLALIVKAQHMCMTIRGVRDKETFMTTSVMRGAMLSNPQLRQEFLTLISKEL